jgi:hypothetical protein
MPKFNATEIEGVLQQHKRVMLSMGIGGVPESLKMVAGMLQQLLDAMRENQRLREELGISPETPLDEALSTGINSAIADIPEGSLLEFSCYIQKNANSFDVSGQTLISVTRAKTPSTE